jgi:16S rRNA (cytosine1402-N4)-methyltransferase
MINGMVIHKPVLLKESIELLQLKPGMTVVDATLGGGGHSLEILRKIEPRGKLIAIDEDCQAIERFENIPGNLKLSRKKENVILINDNFSRLEKILERLKIGEIDAVVADLGVSSDQLSDKGKGFSFLSDGPLDMRMNPEGELTAGAVVNNYSEKDLASIFWKFSEERYARRIAKEIANQRKIRPIRGTLELVGVISRAIPEKYKHQKLHFATRVFQALRIEINREIENLEKFLPQAVDVLKPGGRIAVISFHSGEDRIVKNFFRENARGCICPVNFPVCRCRGTGSLKIITKKPTVPTEKEIRENPRARSAKMRVAEKLLSKQIKNIKVWGA